MVGWWSMVDDGGRGVLGGDGFASRRRWCSITAAWERFGARGLRRRRATFDARWFRGERSTSFDPRRAAPLRARRDGGSSAPLIAASIKFWSYRTSQQSTRVNKDPNMYTYWDLG